MPSFSANLRPAAKAGWIVSAASLHLRNSAKGQSEVPDILEAIEQPAEVEIDEIVIRPTAQDF